MPGTGSVSGPGAFSTFVVASRDVQTSTTAIDISAALEPYIDYDALAGGWRYEDLQIIAQADGGVQVTFVCAEGDAGPDASSAFTASEHNERVAHPSIEYDGTTYPWVNWNALAALRRTLQCDLYYYTLRNIGSHVIEGVRVEFTYPAE